MNVKTTKDKQFPIEVKLNPECGKQLFTKKAAIELRTKLDAAISELEVAEALSS